MHNIFLSASVALFYKFGYFHLAGVTKDENDSKLISYDPLWTTVRNYLDKVRHKFR